ncbi:transcriptional regulator Myc-like [Dunckerocampus dactyliophorus]|uniref:transcriptional regulator Myc-like n=1 Tax=Dunckerocampus dactyliophorus TaxID=161453 RepID=UPI0024059A50|nr:transcriptional regulator Myc-like [Dunckerocampus dactyliophorus]
MEFSRNCDSDYDVMKPYYFLDGEEEFLSGPSKDIWKKPLSPSCTSSETAWDLLDQGCPSSVLLQSFIIHDCMWSTSFAAASKLENAVSQMLVSLQARCDSASSTTDIAGDCHTHVSQVKTSHNLDFPTTPTVCINPSEVLPFWTLCKRSCEVSKVAVAGVNVSTSEGEPVEDDEVDRRPLSDVNIQQHSYATRQPSANHQQPAGKQVSIADTHCVPSHSAFAPYYGRSKVRRKRRYVRECQRKKELKRNLLALRAHIPGQAHNHKGSKVAILENATELITTVQVDKKRLVAKKEELMARRRELKHRLKQLAS